MKKTSLNILNEYFGYDNFRGDQSDIIESINSNKDTLAIMTTGGGKSICYQIPALMREGTTIVISPLISLMKDQVDALLKKGIPATFINSDLPSEEVGKRLLGIKNHSYKLIYIAPETLATNEMILALSKAKVSLLAIDEAHCISMWGKDFRKDYSKISHNIKKIESKVGYRIQRCAFTATATEETRADIVKQLEMTDHDLYVGDFDRPNIRFSTHKASGKKSDNSGLTKGKILSRLIEKHRGQSVIIYCSTISQVKTITESLKNRNYKAKPYYGSLSPYEKSNIQDDFLEGKIDIVVATNAFGMGVDKPDVRAVIHTSMPGNIENYYQEAGRAGRDGKESYAYMIYDDKDFYLHDFFAANSYPDIKYIHSVKEALCSYLGGNGIGFLTAGEIANISTEVFKNKIGDNVTERAIPGILAILQEQEILEYKGDYKSEGFDISIINPHKSLELSWLPERRLSSANALRHMKSFTESKKCLRTTVLKYFGQKPKSKNCSNCGSCLKGTEKEINLKPFTDQDTQTVLDLIKSAPDLSETMLKSTLLGVENTITKRKGLSNLSQFGSLKHKSSDYCSFILDDLLQRKFITKISNKFSVNEENIASEKNIQKHSTSEETKINDPELFEFLKEELTRIQLKKKLSRSALLTEKSLMAIATNKPRTISELTDKKYFATDLCIKTSGKEIIDSVERYERKKQKISKSADLIP